MGRMIFPLLGLAWPQLAGWGGVGLGVGVLLFAWLEIEKRLDKRRSRRLERREKED